MIVFLSPTAMSNAKSAASIEHKPVQKYVEAMLEGIFANETCYIVLRPIPHHVELQAINQFIDVLRRTEGGYFGFKMLTEKEMTEHAARFTQDHLSTSEVSSANVADPPDVCPNCGGILTIVVGTGGEQEDRIFCASCEPPAAAQEVAQ